MIFWAGKPYDDISDYLKFQLQVKKWALPGGSVLLHEEYLNNLLLIKSKPVKLY